VTGEDVNPTTHRHYLGKMDSECEFCHAKLWKKEVGTGMCCQHGKVELEKLPAAPPRLKQLFSTDTKEARQFREHVRQYNSSLAFTSMGVQLHNTDRSDGVDHTVGTLAGSGIYTYRIHGSVYHKIGSLQPPPNMAAKFAQIYIHDPSMSSSEVAASELDRRAEIFPSQLDQRVLMDLQQIVRDHCPYVSIFQGAYETLTWNQVQDRPVRMVIKSNHAQQSKQYAKPTAAEEISVILPGDGLDGEPGEEIHRHIQLRLREGGLQFIHETDSSYDPLQYVLFFPHGEQGWHPDLLQTNQHKRITPK
jgi:hypothetical protein